MTQTDLDHLSVDVKRVALFRRGRFFAAVIIFGLLGILFAGSGQARYFRPYDVNIFFRLLPWSLLTGIILGLVVGFGITLYNPFPRALKGRIILDKVEDGRLAFRGEDGKPRHLKLGKLVVNIHTDKVVHFGLPPKFLIVEAQSAPDMARLTSALRPEVRILRRFGDDLPSASDS